MGNPPSAHDKGSGAIVRQVNKLAPSVPFFRKATLLAILFLPLVMLHGCDAPGKPSQSSNTTLAASFAAPIQTGSNRIGKDRMNLGWLPPANRFSEYAGGDAFRPAQDALNGGDVETAYNSFMSRDQSLDSPREKRFADVLELAFQQQSRTTPASNYIERVQTYWLPQLKALPNVPLGDNEPCHKRANALKEFDYDVEDGQTLTFDRQQSKIAKAFKAELSKKRRVSC